MKYAMLAVAIMAVAITGCGGGAQVIHVGAGAGVPWGQPYVDGMTGAENLAFDGAGSLFVTGLDGRVFRIEPTGNPYRGRIAAERKLGTMCLGIETGPDGMVYVGVADEKGRRRIGRMTRDLSDIVYLTGPVEGLNGFARDSRGYLYFASSNERLVCARGKILRCMMGDDGSFKNPEVVVDKTGMANGLAFSPDESVLYYTETLDGLWSFDMKTREKKKVFSPGSFFHVTDDVTADGRGELWVCWNSGLAVVHVRDGKASAYRVGDLKAPSSCRFGLGRGFRPDFLYITEFGLKGRSFTMNGRGVWVLPVSDLDR